MSSPASSPTYTNTVRVNSVQVSPVVDLDPDESPEQEEELAGVPEEEAPADAESDDDESGRLPAGGGSAVRKVRWGPASSTAPRTSALS